MDRAQIGQQAEAAAERYLIKQGLRTVTKNARCRLGEIDLIMNKNELLVFVEVRVRKHSQFGGAVASVDRSKQMKLIRAAQFWLSRNPRYAQWPCRFDLIAIDSGSIPPKCIWYKDAFRPESTL